MGEGRWEGAEGKGGGGQGEQGEEGRGGNGGVLYFLRSTFAKRFRKRIVLASAWGAPSIQAPNPETRGGGRWEGISSVLGFMSLRISLVVGSGAGVRVSSMSRDAFLMMSDFAVSQALRFIQTDCIVLYVCRTAPSPLVSARLGRSTSALSWRM